MNTLAHEGRTFEIVDNIPKNYHIWNIGHHMMPGYLPLVQINKDYHVIGEPKAIKVKDSEKVLKVSIRGLGDIRKLQRYIDKHENDATRERTVREAREALNVLLTVNGSNNLQSARRL